MTVSSASGRCSVWQNACGDWHRRTAVPSARVWYGTDVIGPRICLRPVEAGFVLAAALNCGRPWTSLAPAKQASAGRLADAVVACCSRVRRPKTAMALSAPPVLAAVTNGPSCGICGAGLGYGAMPNRADLLAVAHRRGGRAPIPQHPSGEGCSGHQKACPGQRLAWGGVLEHH